MIRRNTSFGAKSNRAKVSDDLVRSGGASIGTIRNKLFKELLKHMPDHPGFRPAPLPSQCVALRLRRSHVGGVKAAKSVEGIPDLKWFLVGSLTKEEQLQFPRLTKHSSRYKSIDNRLELLSTFDEQLLLRFMH